MWSVLILITGVGICAIKVVQLIATTLEHIESMFNHQSYLFEKTAKEFNKNNEYNRVIKQRNEYREAFMQYQDMYNALTNYSSTVVHCLSTGKLFASASLLHKYLKRNPERAVDKEDLAEYRRIMNVQREFLKSMLAKYNPSN